MARDRSGTCAKCAREYLRLDLHKPICKGPVKPKGLPLAEIHNKWPSTKWGQDEWYQALRNDDGLFYAILDGIAGLTRKNRWN